MTTAQTTSAKGQTLNPGAVSLGIGHQQDTVYRMIFICRKAGLDYVGQIKLDAEAGSLHLEVFNEGYFPSFSEPAAEVSDALENKVLSLITRNPDIDERFQKLAKDTLDLRKATLVEEEEVQEEVPVAADERDLQAIYDRLNEEYFNGRLSGTIEWSRDSKTTNRRSFKFGSYDPKRELIRIHPRLNQEFVPVYVLELTVYHEMCHQAVPPVRRNGQWQTHHRDFKKKEKEYRHYREAMKWEKNHWAKLLATPSA
jgi:hypothetical protein